MLRVAFVLPLVAGCSSKSAEPQVTPPPGQVMSDAGTDGITTIRGYEPQSGMHLDDDAPAPVVARAQTRPGRPVDITLRSSPAGARVAVDGVPKGVTPAYWEGTTGAEHEFTFVLEGYAMARYRFVPIASGVVHARLEPIAEELPRDGGVRANVPAGLPPEVAPIGPASPPPPVSPALDAAMLRPSAPDGMIPGAAADAAVTPGPPGAGPQP